MLMGTTKILVYAHVFTNMHEDLLIGINGMVENSIIVDPAGHKTFVSGDASSQVDLSISKGGALELKLDGEVHETIAATIARPQKRARFTVSSDEHILNVYQDTVIEPAAESGQQGTRQPVSAQLVATSQRGLLNLYCSRTLVTTSPGTSPTPWNNVPCSVTPPASVLQGGMCSVVR